MAFATHEPSTFHYAADSELSQKVPDPFSIKVGERTATLNLVNSAYFDVTLPVGGDVKPETTKFWLEAKTPTVILPASAMTAGFCPFIVYVGVLSPENEVRGFWYACLTLVPVLDGIHEFSISWSGSLSTVSAQPGDRIYSSLWSESNSKNAVPTLFLLGGPDHPSHFVMSGLPGPEHAEENPPEEPSETTTTPSSGASTSSPPSTTKPTTSGNPSTSNAPTSKAAPPVTTTEAPQLEAKSTPGLGILLLAGIALLAWAVRRRLA